MALTKIPASFIDTSSGISGDTTLTGNLTLTGYLAGPATFTIDPSAVGDNTGTVVIAGNLQVDGTTTTINSTTMTVDDLNITLASGAANAAAADGAGITVDGASATLTYNSTPDAWSFNKNVGIGTASPSVKLDVNGEVYVSPNTAGKNTFQLTTNASDDARFKMLSDTTVNVDIQANGASYFNGGNVGIGTTSPSYTLHVSKASSVIAGFGDSNTEDKYIRIANSSGNFEIGTHGTNGHYLYGTGSVPLRFFTNSAESMRIASNGDVMIGSSVAPVGVGLAVNSGISSSSTTAIEIQQNTTGAVKAAAALGVVIQNGGEATNAADLSFSTASGGSLSERMRITNGGKLTYGGISYGVAVDPDGSGGFGAGYNFETNAGSPRHLVTGPLSGQYLSSGSSPFIAWYTAASAATATAAAERMRIDSSGNLLVGLSSSLTNGKLQVAGDIGLSGNTQIRQATNADGNTLQVFATQLVAGSLNSVSYTYTGGGLLAGLSNGDGVVILDAGRQTSTAGRFKVVNTTNSNIALSLEKNSVYTLYADTGSGNVGIGTSSPESPLDITNTRSTGYSTTSDQRNLSHLTLRNADETVGAFSSLNFYTGAGTGADWSLNNVRTGSYVGDLTFKTRAGGGSADWRERVRITNSGNVGIGTSSPDTLLHLEKQNLGTSIVNTVIRLTDIDTALSDPQVIGRIEFESLSSTDPGIIARIDALSTSSTPSESNGNLLFYTGANASNLGESMRLDSSGNVGLGNGAYIGTLSSTHSLSIQGGAGAPGGKITLYGGTGSNRIDFLIGASEAMRIDSSGSLVLNDGVSYTANAPTNRGSLILAGASGGETYGGIEFHTSSGGGAGYGTKIASSDSTIVFEARANSTTWTESMRVAGNVLYVGKSSQDISLAGHEFHPQGFVFHTRANAEVLYLRRNSSDGPIQNFYRDGSLVGSIGVNAQRPYIGARLASTDANIKFTDVQILPCDATGANTDGTDDIGSSSARFRDLYLSGGVYLGGTASGNLLNDYEEGSWEPQVYYQNATDQAGATNTVQSGKYVKIGNLVILSFRLDFTAPSSPANDNIGVKNFPFAGANNHYNASGTVITSTSFTELILGPVLAGSTSSIITNSANGSNYGDDFGTGTGKYIRGTITYLTN